MHFQVINQMSFTSSGVFAVIANKCVTSSLLIGYYLLIFPRISFFVT
ncbi:unnamed protein product, partial [Callosobruchus maculatus]